MMMTLLASLPLTSAALGGVEIAADHEDGLYSCGEKAVFTVSVTDAAGLTVPTGCVAVILDNFGTVRQLDRLVDLADGNPFKVEGTLPEPGFLRMTVRHGSTTRVWSVGYDVLNIRQDEPRPADIDEYCTTEKARLEKTVLLDPRRERDEALSADKSIVNCIGSGHGEFAKWIRDNPRNPSWIDRENCSRPTLPSSGLRMGVLSDLHLTEPTSEATFEHALRWFDTQKADAVIVCGDLTDLGIESQLQLAAETWFRVFPKNCRSDGAPIEKLFIYGDHDTGLNPKTLEHRVPDEAERRRLSIPENDRKAIWERYFREPWEQIRLKDVKGYKFVLNSFNATKPGGDRSDWEYGQRAWGLPEFLERHAAELEGTRPFFYVQHRVLKGTAGGEWIWGQDDGFSTETLSRYPNCVAFCGHSHAMGTDERNVWQGTFTAIEVPSLSYLTTFCGHENGFALWDEDFAKPKSEGLWPPKQMPVLDVGSETNPVARHGYLVDVFSDCLRVERRCFVTDRDVGPDWTLPLGASAGSPFAHESRARHDPAPEFPPGSEAKAVCAKGTDRFGTDTDQIVITFPAAASTDRTPRAYDYEVQPVLVKRGMRRLATAKRVYSSGILRAEDQDREQVACVFSRREIPSDVDFYEFVVTPFNAFGRGGLPLSVRLSGKTAVVATSDRARGGIVCDFNVRDYPSVSATASACLVAGGGRIVVPNGVWKTGKIHLGSNCELHLEDGAELLFSDNPKDYLPAVRVAYEGVECYNYSPLVYAYGATNVAVTGKGTLRAEHRLWYAWHWPGGAQNETKRNLYYKWSVEGMPVEKRVLTEIPQSNCRPQFIHFNRCRDVRIEGVTVRNSPFWCIHTYACDGVVVRNVDVCAHIHNSDGLDLEMTKNALVEGCVFCQGDDAICVKAGKNADGRRVGICSENIEIRNCEIKAGHQLLAIGSEVSAGIRNVWLHDCKMTGATFNGLLIKTNKERGGFVENIRFERVTAEHLEGAPVAIDANTYYSNPEPGVEIVRTRICDVFVRDVAVNEAERTYSIIGDPGLPIRNVCLENVSVRRPLKSDGVAVNVEQFETR